MPKYFFEFKKFIIRQYKCVMKVGTDGVLLGAWTSAENIENALDIGTGTGLIALMLAQKSCKNITAIEIDKNAFLQAKENINNSVFKNNIIVIHKSFQEFAKTINEKFSLIVSNPPFFNHHKLSDKKNRNIARHTISLSFEDLIFYTSNLLKKTGIFSVIIPFDEKEFFIEKCKEYKLYPAKICDVKPTTEKFAKRTMISFSFIEQEPIKSEIIIETTGRHIYSDKYIELTKDFYLDKIFELSNKK